MRNAERNTRGDRYADRFESGVEYSGWGEESTQLHELRPAAVIDELARCGARSVLDLGCGDGKLIERLVAQRLLALSAWMSRPTQYFALGWPERIAGSQLAKAKQSNSLN